MRNRCVIILPINILKSEKFRMLHGGRRLPSLLSPRFRRVPLDGCRRIFARRLLITRSNPSPKGGSNRRKNGPGWSDWAGLPMVFWAWFGPIFRGRASLAIVSFCLLDCVAF
jgi:hypothetical protein